MNNDEDSSYWLTGTGSSIYRVWKDWGSRNVLKPVLPQRDVPRAGVRGAGRSLGSTGIGMLLDPEDYRNQLQVKMLAGRIVDGDMEVHHTFSNPLIAFTSSGVQGLGQESRGVEFSFSTGVQGVGFAAFNSGVQGLIGIISKR